MATLLSLPLEIRLQIFTQLLVPESSVDISDLISFDRSTDSVMNRQRMKKPLSKQEARPAMLIRNVDPYHFRTFATLDWPRDRAIYNIDFGNWRQSTTYECVTRGSVRDGISLMFVNRAIHEEAAQVLYGSLVFDFDTHFNAVVPFLSDLTPYSRSCIKALRIVKPFYLPGSVTQTEAWRKTMCYLAHQDSEIALRDIYLGIIAGKVDCDVSETLLSATQQGRAQGPQPEQLAWVRDVLRLPACSLVRVFAVKELCGSVVERNKAKELAEQVDIINAGLAAYIQQRLTAVS